MSIYFFYIAMEQYWEFLILIPIGYSLVVQIQQGKQIAVMQKTVDGIDSKLNMYMKTETDLLKETLSENNRVLQRIANKQ